MSRTMRALEVAFDLHQGQERKCDKSPYVVHVLDVARLLLSEPGTSEDVVVAGILHDTLEDTRYTSEQLESDFGRKVRQLVESVTEPLTGRTDSGAEKRYTWRQRKQYKLDLAAGATRDQLLVSIADKVSNLQSMRDDLLIFGPNMWEHFSASKKEVRWYHESMWAIFQERLEGCRMLPLYRELMRFVFDE